MTLDLFTELKPLPLADAELAYAAHWQSASTADRWLAELLAEIPWSQHRVKLFGREMLSPRLSSWHGDEQASYAYSGTRHLPAPWTPTLLSIRQQLQDFLSQRFNGVLVNRYRSGADSMGWHADNEAELGPQPLIASISLGQERRFSLKHRDRGERFQLRLGHGSLLLMSGATQRHWLHALPKDPGCRDERVNLTFRQLLAPRFP